MNYEEFYKEVSDSAKAAETAAGNAHKSAKKVTAALAGGDLKNAAKALAAMQEQLAAAAEQLKKTMETTGSFDQEAYFRSGDFKEDIIAECGARGIDVQSDSSTILEMFPSRLTLNKETLDVTIDKKKESCLRPSTLVDKIKAAQDKMAKTPFNEERFLEEFAQGYDTAILFRGKKGGGFVKMSDIYKYMAPTARARKEYDRLSFAFDLARLYNSETRITKDGRKLDFDTNRELVKGNPIRILDSTGHQNYLIAAKFEESML
ncbi:MAG: hypothetical protein IKD69_16310 [Solobacterium sp.]|nr:hypothetical protein [Solobacterium sp.]